MSELQIKLVIGNTEINLHGDGDLVYTIFKDICNNGLGVIQKPVVISDNSSKEENRSNQETRELKDTIGEISSNITKGKSKKKPSTTSAQLLKHLNLTPNSGTTLQEFIDQKKPKSNVEKTAVFVYYLQNYLHEAGITMDHIFTCYKSITSYKIPENLQQNLTDTASSRYGYLDRKDGKYMMSTRGINFVEHNLPAKEK